jgi:hypothetical protein
MMKPFTFIDKKPAKNVFEIENNLWKDNITFNERKKHDWLDVSNEDFTRHKTRDINGNIVNPSTFSIFRDSLSKTSALLQERLIENLPDIN